MKSKGEEFSKVKFPQILPNAGLARKPKPTEDQLGVEGSELEISVTESSYSPSITLSEMVLS